jgi:hypothetical protein
MIITYKFKLHPYVDQNEILLKANMQMELYNAFLIESRYAHKERIIPLNHYDQQKELPELKEFFMENRDIAMGR